MVSGSGPVPPYIMDTLVTPLSISAYDSFGTSVSIKDNTIAVGADVGGQTTQGVVHTFRRNNGTGWSHDNEFLAQDGSNGDRYGNSVVIWDEWLFVGAMLQDMSGKVYVYRNNDTHWMSHSELLPLVRVDHGYFGHRIRAKNYTLAVSHPRAMVEQEDESGNVNVFNNWGLSWVLGNVITPPTPAPGALHGFSVDFNRGDQMLVGAPKEGDTGHAYMYIYVDTSWVVSFGIPGLANAELGHAVAVNDGHVVISSRIGGPTGNGYVVTFKNDTDADSWIQNDVILTGTVTDGVGAFYGNDVAIHDDVLVVGSPFEGDTGAIYIYHWWGDSWTLHYKILGPVTTSTWYHSMFGWSVDMGADVLVVGSPGSNTVTGTEKAGAVFVFTDFQFAEPTPTTETPTTTTPTTETPTTETPTTETPTTTTTATPTAPTVGTLATITPMSSGGVRPYMTILVTTLLMANS
jgi:hypothetical protein